MTLNDFQWRVNEYAANNSPFFFLIDFEKKNPLVLTVDEVERRGIRFVTPAMSQPSKQKAGPSKVFELRIDPVQLKTYQQSFSKVKKHLLEGNSYLVNLTFPTDLSNNYSLSELFYGSDAPYKLYYPNKFVTFSPESFIRIQDQRIYAYPMKGTIDADLPNAAQTILENEKEQWEHNTIVDLIRNDLSMIAERVEVSRFRYLDRIRTNRKDLLQVSSEIRGHLKPGWQSSLGNILLTLTPAGSVSGAPKKKTLEIIQESELVERGYYSGVFGYFDGLNLDSAVNIRFIEKTEKGLCYRSGGGITAMSEMKSEYQEMIDKIYVPTI